MAALGRARPTAAAVSPQPGAAAGAVPGATPWGSNRTLADLLGEPEAFHVFAPSWQPLFWNLAERSAEELLRSGEAWLQMLAVIRAEREELPSFEAVLREATRQLGGLRGAEHVRWYNLMRIVLAYATWRRPPAERQQLLAAVQASQTDLASREEIQTMTQTIANEWLAEGRAQGRAEGPAEGALRTARELLRESLERRFGPLPEELSQRINTVSDLERLKAAVLQAPDLSHLSDLRL